MKQKHTPSVSIVGGPFLLPLVLSREQEMRIEIGFDRGLAQVELYGWSETRQRA